MPLALHNHPKYQKKKEVIAVSSDIMDSLGNMKTTRNKAKVCTDGEEDGL